MFPVIACTIPLSSVAAPADSTQHVLTAQPAVLKLSGQGSRSAAHEQLQQWRDEAICCTGGSAASRNRGEELCYRAERRAEWLVENKGLSQDEAKLQVMSEFPEMFAGGGVAVVSGFWQLDRTTHGMDTYLQGFNTSTDVPAPYFMLGDTTTLDVIANMRSKRKQITHVRSEPLHGLIDDVATAINVDTKDLMEAARLSAEHMPSICPSAEVLLIWLAKPFTMLRAIPQIKKLPEFAGSYTNGFAWIDAGYQTYRDKKPPPPPWTTFWPRDGALAVTKLKRACHGWRLRESGDEHDEDDKQWDHTSCPIGSILYGSEEAWQAFADAHARVVRDLVLGNRSRELCSDQDVFETVAQANPQLVDEYETSEQHYGWRDARPKQK